MDREFQRRNWSAGWIARSWTSGIPLLPLIQPHLSGPTPISLRLFGLLRLQAKGAFCFTSEPGASRRASNIKTEAVLSVQSARLYIRGCHAAAMRLPCTFFYTLRCSQKKKKKPSGQLKQADRWTSDQKQAHQFTKCKVALEGCG